jgi:hypothetical protein
VACLSLKRVARKKLSKGAFTWCTSALIGNGQCNNKMGIKNGMSDKTKEWFYGNYGLAQG